jgi:hypothetical protein
VPRGRSEAEGGRVPWCNAASGYLQEVEVQDAILAERCQDQDEYDILGVDQHAGLGLGSGCHGLRRRERGGASRGVPADPGRATGERTALGGAQMGGDGRRGRADEAPAAVAARPSCARIRETNPETVSTRFHDFSLPGNVPNYCSERQQSEPQHENAMIFFYHVVIDAYGFVFF